MLLIVYRQVYTMDNSDKKNIVLISEHNIDTFKFNNYSVIRTGTFSYNKNLPSELAHIFTLELILDVPLTTVLQEFAKEMIVQYRRKIKPQCQSQEDIVKIVGKRVVIKFSEFIGLGSRVARETISKVNKKNDALVQLLLDSGLSQEQIDEKLEALSEAE